MRKSIGKRLFSAGMCVAMAAGIAYSGHGLMGAAGDRMAAADTKAESAAVNPVSISFVEHGYRAVPTAENAEEKNKADLAFSYGNSFMDLVMNSADDMTKHSYADKIVSITEPYLNIREAADAGSEAVGRLYPGAYGVIEEQGEEWTKITSGEVVGYIKNEYVAFDEEAKQLADELGEKIAIAEDEGVAVYTSADETSEKLSDMEAGKIYSICLDELSEEADTADVADGDETESKTLCEKLSENEWVKIYYDEDKTGYVRTEQVDIADKLEEAMTMEAAQERDRAQAQKLAEEKAAKQASAPAAGGSASKQPEQSAGAQVSAGTSDAYLLACIVYCESGNQSYEGQLAVANVVLNRVRSAQFPNTISEVVYQSGQFTPAFSGSLANVIASGPSASAVQAANDALAGNNNIGSYLFFNGYVDTSKVGSYVVIGDHTFYNY